MLYLHVEALGFLDKRRRHGQEYDVCVHVRRAVVGVEALDASFVHLFDYARHYVKPGKAGS